MVPAGTIESIDWREERVYVDRTKQQIEHAPQFTDTHPPDQQYRDQLDTYFSGTYEAQSP